MNQSDVAQIEKLFLKHLQDNNKQLRQVIKKDIKAEIEPLSERLDSQSKQIVGIKEKLTGVEQQIEGIDTRVAGLEKKFDGLEKKI